MSALEYARLLMAKSRQDELVVEKLAGDPDVSDEVLGFHAQQAIEKLLKAVLTEGGIPFRRTHDLTELIDLLARESVQSSMFYVPGCGPEDLEPGTCSLKWSST